MEINRRGFLLGTTGAVASVAAMTGVSTPAMAATTYQVATRKIDITPSAGFPMGGYGVEGRTSTGVNEPLMARCTVIWDEGTPNVIVTADVLAFGSTMHRNIRAKVVQLGVANSDFVLTATHTHNGPALIEKLDPQISYNSSAQDLQKIATYSSQLVTKIVQLVSNTLAAARTTCTLDYHVVGANFSFNRAGLSYEERDVPVLVARESDGTPRAVLFGYGAHPVAAGQQAMFDPDYPAEAIKRIEEMSVRTFAQFMLGPAGDQNPSVPDGPSPFIASDSLGDSLGRSVRAAITNVGRVISGGISTNYRVISLPLDVTNTPQNLASVAAAYDARAVSDAPFPDWERRHATKMAQAARDRTFDTTVDLPLQVWKFSGGAGLKIVFAGGEIVSGYAVYFRVRNGGSAQLWFNGYSNEVPAYIPSNELLNRQGQGLGGYEAGISPDQAGLAGGSMAVYNHFGHFLRKMSASSPDGVEEKVISALTNMLA